MDAALLRSILESSNGFKGEGHAFSVTEGFEVSIHLAIDSYDAAIDRVRAIRVEHGFVAITSGDKATTTYADASNVATIAVREEARADRKRPGFA